MAEPNPHRAVYGFALYLSITTLFLFYIFWAYVPHSFLHGKELGFFPDKYFAVYIPVILLTGVTCFAFFIYPSANLIQTPNEDDISTVTDRAAIVKYKFTEYESICPNLLRKGSIKIWRTKSICSAHNFANEITNQIQCDCPKHRTCFLRQNGCLISILKKRNKIPSLKDLDLAEVCYEMFANDFQ